jgi:hypothetical protein
MDNYVKNMIDKLRVEFAKPGPGGHLPLPAGPAPDRLLNEADRNYPRATPCRKCGEPVSWDSGQGLLLHQFTSEAKCSYILDRRKELP